MRAFDVPVPVGTYCTRIVQFAPGMRTEPDTQVPPVVIEKVPPFAKVVTIVGAAVSVSVPGVVVVLEVLVTVTVPFFVVVLAVEVVNAGTGAEMPTTARPPVPVKVTGVVSGAAGNAKLTFSLALFVPVDVGVKLTLIVQEVAGVVASRLDGQLFVRLVHWP